MPTTSTPPMATTRQSYFLEGPMEEYTPASSMRVNSIDDPSREEIREFDRPRVDGSGNRVKHMSQLLNAIGHIGLCFVLLAIMTEFMVRYRGEKREPQTIALIILIGVDCLLDIYAMIRMNKKWQGWAMVLRLLLGLSYIAHFIVYIGFRHIFPHGYTYWGINTEYSEPVMYLLLWIAGIWNLVHSAVHRHALGRDLRTCANAFRSFRQRPRQVNSNHPIETRHTESALQQRTNSSAHVESRPTNMEAVIYLGEMARVNHRTDLTVPSPTRSSITITRSESKAESIGTSDSRTVSAATSRRASIAGSEVTLGPGGDEDDMQRKIKA